MDGSPQPKLAWFKGDSDKELPNTNFSLNPFSQLSMHLKVTREDNDREYRYNYVKENDGQFCIFTAYKKDEKAVKLVAFLVHNQKVVIFYLLMEFFLEMLGYIMSSLIL